MKKIKKRRLVYKPKKHKSKVQQKADLLYHKYVIRYNRAKKRLEKQGFSMREEKLSKEEFAQERDAIYNDLLDQVKKGLRMSVGDVSGYIIDRQKFAITSKQARAIRREWTTLRELMEEETGEKLGPAPSQYQIRSGQAFDFEVLKAIYHALRESGYDPEDAAAYISEEYFGS